METTRADVLTFTKACYQVLSDHLREAGAGPTDAHAVITTRMRGGAGRGLIYAPPPETVAGERWWAPSRVVQNDAMRWVGPYLGQLAGRYRSATQLWEALGIRRDLTPEIACEVITRDLSRDGDKSRAHEYYGRLVSFLEDSRLADRVSVDTPALTTLGWRPACDTWWTNRPEILDAFATSIAWWQPGSRDPSSLRHACSFLGIHEATPASESGPLAERWEIRGSEPLELQDEARWQLAVRTWPHVLREDSDPAQWPAFDVLAHAVQSFRPVTAQNLRLHMAFSSGGEVVRASIEPSVALRVRDQRLVGRSSTDLFTAQAATMLATLVPANQRASSLVLALLLSMAAHDPDELDRRAAHYAVAGYQHRDFVFEMTDADDLDTGAVDRVPLKVGRKHRTAEGAKEQPFAPLADTMRYGLTETTTSVTQGEPPSPLGIGKLRPPTTVDDQEEEEPQYAKTPPAARMRYTNLDIEGAARPFIEEYELARRGCTVVRQGPNVGADFVASDGRYIEVKAFSEAAPDSFELEAPEWRAAQHPEVADRYWVYVVEHLRDGEPPKITAVFNPVLDDATSKEPTGKLRVRGWKASQTQQYGLFGERQAPSDED
jgi:hypothetical protein